MGFVDSVWECHSLSEWTHVSLVLESVSDDSVEGPQVRKSDCSSTMHTFSRLVWYIQVVACQTVEWISLPYWEARGSSPLDHFKYPWAVFF